MVLRALFLRTPDPAPQAAEGTGPQQPAHRRWRWLVWLRWAVIGAVWAGFAGGLLFLWLIYDLPRPEQAFEAVRRPSLRLVDRSDHLFASFGDVVGEPLHLVELPPFLPAAVVAIEDRRFYRHHGIDLLGGARRLDRPVRRACGAGRLDADPASRQNPLLERGADMAAQSAGIAAHALA